MTEEVKPKSKRGFGSMSPERRREIAAKGGASVPSDKRTFSKDKDLAALAGAKGGSSSRSKPA
jgi:general stress protein YciG